jgi:hypothetical protein
MYTKNKKKTDNFREKLGKVLSGYGSSKLSFVNLCVFLIPIWPHGEIFYPYNDVNVKIFQQNVTHAADAILCRIVFSIADHQLDPV